MISGAIRTDFILSAEIMVIALNEVADEAFVSRAISSRSSRWHHPAVYGVVGLIVKMDDIGLPCAARSPSPRFGRGLVQAMPKLLP